MPKLVDVDKVAEAIDWLNEYDFILWNEIMKCIDKVPEVDAVPVVRCKDCKHFDWWVSQGKEVFECYRFLESPPITPEWYCAWGEKREDENN